MAHIVVNDISPVDQYTASGGAQTQFTVSYPFYTDASLKVYLTPVGATADDATDILALTTNYTVTGSGNVVGVTKRITLVVAATDGDVITIRRDEPVARLSDLQDLGDFLAETHNNEQDLVIMILQQQEELLVRSITRGVTGGGWDGQSLPIKSVSDPVDAQDSATKNYVDTAADSSAAAAAASAVAAAASASYNTPTIQSDSFNAAINSAYILNRAGSIIVTLPDTPANGSRIKLHSLFPQVAASLVCQSADLIVSNLINYRTTNQATGGSSAGLLEDSSRNGDGTDSRLWITDALIGMSVRNRTTGLQSAITDNDETTLTCGTLAWTSGDVYMVGYGTYNFASSVAARNPTPLIIELVYHLQDQLWLMSVSGDNYAVPYNTHHEQHRSNGMPGELEINSAKSIEVALDSFHSQFSRIVSGRNDTSLRLMNVDASFSSADNAQAPVTTHFDMTANRTVTLESQSNGVEYYLINGTTGTVRSLILTAGTSVTNITLIKSGSVTRSVSNVTIPTGSACRVRPISATEWIVYDADAAVTK